LYCVLRGERRLRLLNEQGRLGTGNVGRLNDWWAAESGHLLRGWPGCCDLLLRQMVDLRLLLGNEALELVQARLCVR
jgi:hypothetical protein